MTLSTLKLMLNPSTSNLESLSLDDSLILGLSVEKLSDFVRQGFARLRTLKVSLRGGWYLGELISYSCLYQALSKPGIASLLVVQVNHL